MGIIIAILVLALLALGTGVGIYNKLISNRNLVQEGWSGIDVQLKRRADLIPNLIQTAKGYMGHERGVLESVTELRTKALSAQSIPERSAAEGMLSGALSRVFAVAENYPDLKANTTFLELQKNLSEIEDQVQLARRYYNGAARNFNIVVESFPSNIVANMFGFTKFSYFELENPQDKEVPKVQF